MTLSEFRNQQSLLLAVAQREPVVLTSRGVGRRAVVVSPDFFDRAVQALEDLEDVRAAQVARVEAVTSHDDVMAEFGLTE